MSGNKLRQINSNTFGTLENLEELTLSMNLMTKLDENAFSGLITLKKLDLESNELSDINEKHLVFLKTWESYIYIRIKLAK